MKYINIDWEARAFVPTMLYRWKVGDSMTHMNLDYCLCYYKDIRSRAEHWHDSVYYIIDGKVAHIFDINEIDRIYKLDQL